MRREIAEVLTKKVVNLITYGNSDNPHFALGRHMIDQGQIISAYHPYAIEMNVVLEDGTVYPMDSVERTSVFSAFLPIAEKLPYWIEMNFGDGRIKRFRDPYCFESQLSDLDQYLFGEGTHYEIYKKLGAHPMTIDGIYGVNFAVWAPNANRVSVVGDFNMWDGRIHPMRRLGQSGIFELFIPEIGSGELYKYEIKTKTGDIVLKADPYANMSETTPNTASVIADMNSHRWTDKRWMEKRKKENTYERPMSIYEVHIGSWKRQKKDGRILSYREAAKELAKYVIEMGYTHVELMGILEHREDSSWGYKVTGYYAPTSRYGSLKDFMYLVNYLHRKEIGVVIDWVPSYFSNEEYSLAKFDGTFLYEHPNQIRSGRTPGNRILFNYESNEVKNFLIGSALFWLRQCHVDALRVVSVSSMLYLDFDKNHGYGGRESVAALEFLKHLNSIISEYGAGGYTIAEESSAWEGVSRPVSLGGLGFSYKWNTGWVYDFIEYMKINPLMRKYKHEGLTFGMIYAYSEQFILALSHDEVGGQRRSLLDKMPGEYAQHFANLRLAYGFMFGFPGKKLLFMGQEFAQRRNWREDEEIDWHVLESEAHYKMQQYVRDLLHLYRSHAAFYEMDFEREGFEWINCSDTENSVVSFIRRAKSGKGSLVFVYNFLSAAKLSFRIGVPESGIYRLLFSSDQEKYGGEECYQNEKILSEQFGWDEREYSIKVNLPPLSVLIFERRNG